MGITKPLIITIKQLEEELKKEDGNCFSMQMYRYRIQIKGDNSKDFILNSESKKKLLRKKTRKIQSNRLLQLKRLIYIIVYVKATSKFTGLDA